MFEQVKLGYDFAALEPHIDQLTMETLTASITPGYTNNLKQGPGAAAAAAGEDH